VNLGRRTHRFKLWAGSKYNIYTAFGANASRRPIATGNKLVAVRKSQISTKPAAVGRHIKLVGLSITTADKMDSYHTWTSSRIVMLSLPKTLLRPKLSPQCEEEIPSPLAFQSLYVVEL
jgi:hypothetical protein